MNNAKGGVPVKRSGADERDVDKELDVTCFSLGLLLPHCFPQIHSSIDSFLGQ